MLATSSCSQVLPEFRVKPTDNFTQEDVESWQRDAATFLRQAALGDFGDEKWKHDGDKRVKKWFRLQALHSAQALDHMLRCSSGMGLERFAITPPQVLGCAHNASLSEPEPPAPACLGVATDMGASMVSWQYFLRYQSPLVIFHMPDISHPINGNMILALKHSNLWVTILLNKVVFKTLLVHLPARHGTSSCKRLQAC